MNEYKAELQANVYDDDPAIDIAADPLMKDAARLIRELKAELKAARAPYVMEQNNEWMRLFGIVWYSETYHRKRIEALEEERSVMQMEATVRCSPQTDKLEERIAELEHSHEVDAALIRGFSSDVDRLLERIAELESQLDAHESYNAQCPTCGREHWTVLEDKKCQSCVDKDRIETLEAEAVKSAQLVSELRENVNVRDSECDQWQEQAGQAAVRAERLEDRCERLERAIERIQSWASAYPLDIFPEPDFDAVRIALAAAGITLDSVSASNMRHVITGVTKICDEALENKL